MSSSTSNSKRTTWLALAIALLGLELFTRSLLLPSSKEFQKLAELPSLGARLTASPGLRVALLGNSVTERGVDEALFNQELGRLWNQPVSSAVIAANASEVKTWYYMLEASFYRQELAPDVLVVTFFEDNLADGEVQLDRLAHRLTTLNDWPSLFRVDVTGFDERVQFVLASVWATQAAARRVHDRTMNMLLADYPAFATALYWLTHDPQSPHPPKPQPTYRALERFIARLKQRGQRTVFVAYPTRPGDPRAAYAVDPKALELLSAADICVVDLRDAPGITPDLYNADGAHLLTSGKSIYTRLLAMALGQLPAGCVR